MVQCNICVFKAVSNFSFTGHKTQGKTMNEIIVCSYKGHSYNASGWIYVVLSRVRSIDNYFAGMKLSENLKNYKPRTLIEMEHRKLRKMAVMMKRKLKTAGVCGVNRI